VKFIHLCSLLIKIGSTNLSFGSVFYINRQKINGANKTQQKIGLFCLFIYLWIKINGINSDSRPSYFIFCERSPGFLKKKHLYFLFFSFHFSMMTCLIFLVSRLFSLAIFFLLSLSLLFSFFLFTLSTYFLRF